MCGPSTRGIGLARVGQSSQFIRSGTLAELVDVEWGPPLHSLVLVGGEMHDLEAEMYEYFRCCEPQKVQVGGAT